MFMQLSDGIQNKASSIDYLIVFYEEPNIVPNCTTPNILLSSYRRLS